MSTQQEKNSSPSSSAPDPSRPVDDDLPPADFEDEPHGAVQLLLEDSGARRDLRRYMRRHLQLRHRKNPAAIKSQRGRKKRPSLQSNKRELHALRHRWLSRQSRISKHPISDVLLALKKNRESLKPPEIRKKRSGEKNSVAPLPEAAAKSAEVELPSAPMRQRSSRPEPTVVRPRAEWKNLQRWKSGFRSELQTIGNSPVRSLSPKYRWGAAVLVLVVAAIAMLIGRWDGSQERQGLYTEFIREKSQTQSLARNLDIQHGQMERINKELKSYVDDNKSLQAKLQQAEKELQRFDAVRGGLTITTIPEGATIKVGGDAVATAPATFQGLIAQTYPVEVQLEGYEPVSLQAEVKPQQFTDLGSIVLVRSLGSLELKSDPDGANYELTDRNGEKITGKTPMALETIPAGPYHVKMSYPNYPTMEEDIIVRKGDAEKIFWAFGDGELVVKTEPVGADVTVDGEAMGKSPTHVKLQAGTHNVSIQFAPWPPQSRTVQVIKDLPTETTFTLTMGRVEINSDKPGTAIWSGDSFLGRTPLQMEIPTAKHDLWAFSPGRVPQNQELELGAGESKSAEFHMSQDMDIKIDSKAAPSEQYLTIYLGIQEGEKLAVDGKRLEAYKILSLADEKLRRFVKIFPDFERAIVYNRGKSLQKTLTDLEEGRNPPKRSGPMIKANPPGSPQ